MAVNGGRGSSAGWRQSPYAKAWPPALHSAAFAPQTSDSTLHTSPPHSCVEKKKGMQTSSSSVTLYGIAGQLQALGDSPWVSIALQVLSQVPKEMLLRKEQSHTKRQQLPALQGEVVKEKTLIYRKISFVCIYFFFKRKLSTYNYPVFFHANLEIIKSGNSSLTCISFVFRLTCVRE